jgi:serine/threonine-protein kinase
MVAPAAAGDAAPAAVPATQTAAVATVPRPRPPARSDARPRSPSTAEASAREAGGDAARGAASTTPAAVQGTVQFAVSPWASVEVNGNASGVTPPLTRLSLPAGTHSITLRNADFAPVTVQVQVGADQAVTLRHRFGS